MPPSVRSPRRSGSAPPCAPTSARAARGAVELAEAVVEACRGAESSSACSTTTSASLRQKIETIATEVYGAEGVDYLPAAARQLDTYERAGFGALPVCIAKTHLSISSDPKLLGAPDGLAPARPRGPGERGCRLRLSGQRRHAHHAGPVAPPRRGAASTSTRTATWSASTRAGEVPMAIDFTLAPEHEEIRSRVRTFIQDTVHAPHQGLRRRVAGHRRATSTSSPSWSCARRPSAPACGCRTCPRSGAAWAWATWSWPWCRPRPARRAWARGSSTAWRPTRATCTRCCTGRPTSRRTTTCAACAKAPPCRASP